jgi:lipid-binding SYLF domain-containing protein
MQTNRLALTLVTFLVLTACTATGLDTRSTEDRRLAIQEMRDDVLAELYAIKPDTRVQIGSASGYAVFANANVNVILASFGGGVGIVHDNKDNRDIYMRMGEVGIGLGAGVKDFRAVFIFHGDDALDRFLDVGLSIGGQADAAAKAGDLGAAVGGEAIMDNITVYQLTRSGLALQATVKGTRYWRDSRLN